MDARSRRTMVHAGYDVPAHAARQFGAADFADRDLVVALDSGHQHALWWLAAETADVDADRAQDRVAAGRSTRSWPRTRRRTSATPTTAASAGFTDVLAQIERSCAALLAAVREALSTGRPLAVPVVAGRTAGWPDAARQQTDSPPL